MPTVVIPFAGIEGKTRLRTSKNDRRVVSLAMLGDVLEAAAAVGSPRVVTADDEGAAIARELGAELVQDPGSGQGSAVAAALVDLEGGPILIVNADVPCVRAADLNALLERTPATGTALVAARDGTTNALGLSAPGMFAPVYGPDSAARFAAHARALGEVVLADLRNLRDDVDTLEDLERLRSRCGARTRACLVELPVGASQ
jgi:2-phospho-L-lactate guanylyltransferase